MSRYLHLRNTSPFAPGVFVGAVVNQGQLIGYSGDTGGVAPHLHFDLKLNGGAYKAEPMSAVTGFGWYGFSAENGVGCSANPNDPSPYWTSQPPTLRTHPNGAIVQTPSGHVYMLHAGQKRYIPSPLILTTWSDGSDMIPITQSEGAAYPEGSWVGFRPGKLIQDSSNSKVYFITNEGADPWLRGNKRWITSPTVLNQCFPGRPIIGVDAGLASIHPTGANITGCPPNPNGTVGYVPNVAVYMLHQNQKRWVISQSVQNSWFFGPDLVPLFCCPTQASNIGFRPGRLIRKASTGEIFFVTNEGDFGRATKRWVTDPTTLACLFPGEQWIEANDFEANTHPTGTPLSSC